LIVVSNYDKQRGLDRYIANDNKYIIIRYGINYSEFNIRAEDKRREFGIKSDDLVITMVSCFKPQKAPQDFIRLAYLVNKILPNTKFILIGDGILREKLEKLIDRFGLRNQVILTGWRRDIPGMLSTSNVFVLTSFWEGLPVALLEAMASSKPVVVTDTGGVRDVVIEGKTGYLVSLGDTNAMSNRLTALLKDPDLRFNMGRQAKDNLGFDFTVENMLKNTQDLYGKGLYAN